MVEVHLMAGETTATVSTGNFSELAQESRGRFLALTHTTNFAIAVGCVIRDVPRSLVPLRAHAPF